MREKVKLKYGVQGARTDYILTFLDHVQYDLQEFLGKDFMAIKEAKLVKLEEAAKVDAEYLAKKNQRLMEQEYAKQNPNKL